MEINFFQNLIKNTKGQEGMSNNPDSRHYLHKDIFTYVNASSLLEGEDTAQFKSHSVQIGDTIYYSAGFMTLDSVTVNPNTGKHHFTAHDTALMANLTIYTRENRKYNAKPVFYLQDSRPQFVIDTLVTQGIAVRLNGVDGERKLGIGVKESSKMVPFLALKVLQFPFINLVWLGTLIMIIGFLMSMVRRMRF